MSKFDKRGNPVSYGSQAAIDKLDRAFDLLHAYQADPLAEVDAILKEHPDFALAHAFRAGALATATDKAFEPTFLKARRRQRRWRPRRTSVSACISPRRARGSTASGSGRPNSGVARRSTIRAI